GQLTDVPSQVSATSQTPLEARQTKLDGRFASAGQLGELPGQVSATSQTPAAERQTVPNWKPSAGQLAFVPVQVSTVSQTPADERQITPLPLNVFAGQLPDEPVHVSWRSQEPAAGRQTVPLVMSWQVLLQQDVDRPLFAPSSHCSPKVVSMLPSPQRLS